MPTKSPPDASASGLAIADPSVESQDSELAAAGRELAEDLGAYGADESSSPAERRAAERTARRRQRAEAHDVSARRGSGSPRSSVPPPARALLFGGLLPVPLIAVVAGGVLGVILGALSVAGWVIGLLVSGLTVVLLRALGSRSRSTNGGTE